MPKTPTLTKANESGLLFVKNSKTNLVERIATTADLQIGLPESPAETQLFGGISVNTSTISLSAGSVYKIRRDITVLNVEGSGSGNILIKLPEGPSVGQIVIIKDFSGSASMANIVVSDDSYNIDGSASKIISTDYGYLQVAWSGVQWSSVSSSEFSVGAPASAQYVVLTSNPTLTNERALTAGSGISIVDGGAGSTVTISTTGGGSGDVVGPASSTDNAIVRFDLTTGKLIQNSGVTISDSNDIITPGDVAINGGDLTSTATTFNLLNSTVTTLNVGGAATTVTVGASTADVVVGRAEIGAWPAGTSYAFFGNSDYNHSVAGNYALIQASSAGTKNTWLNAPTGGKVYIANNDAALGYLDDNEISLTGKANVDQTITLGSNYGGSYTRIDGGFLGVFISGSLITLTGSSANASLSADARIGSVEIGGLPGYGNSVAMFGHTDLNHAYNNDTSAGMGNYALGQSNDGSTYINSPQNKGIYFLTSGASGLPLGRIYFKTSTLSSELILTGASYFNSNVFLGSSYGQSSTSIYAGTGGIILSGSGASTIITGSTSTQADAYIGSVEVGTHPFWGRNYAMFSHKDMDNSVDGNAALIQAYDGDTFLGAKSTKSIFIKNGTSFIGKLDNDNIELTGDTSTSTATILGNSYGLSSTKMYAGLFGITLSGSATTTITGSSSTNAEAYIGTAEVGELPYTRTSFPNYFAMFGHKTLDHSSNGNYALVQSYDGDTFLNSANSKSIYLQNAGNLIGTLDNDSISLTGQANTSVATEIGSVYGLSSTTIKGGLFGLILTGSGTTITITGSTTSQADAYIGSAEIGVHPFWGRNYAMFSHKDMDNSADGNSALIQAYDGDTFLGAKSTKSIFIKNGTSFIGKFDNDNIELTGDTSTSTATILGNEYLASTTVIKAGGPFASLGGMYLTGSTVTTYTVGGETGTGTISLGRSTASNTINIGNATTTSGNTQTINIASSASGTGLAAITIGNTNGASSLTLNAGTGYTTINGHEIIARTALVAYPSDTVTDYPLQLKVVTGGNTVRWAIGADTGDDLNFSYSLNSTTVASRGYLANTADVAAIDFTGQHRNYPVGGNVLDFSDKIGLIVASVGQYKSLTSGSAEISINEALPLVELSTKRNQKSVFGVISDHEDPNETSRDYVIGNWGSVYEKMQNDDRLIINSLGEGAIWICNINGNLQNGDYITSCEVPGYGMKQDDDILHNYTAAKITCDCDFFLDSTVYRCEEFQHEGKTYRRAFVGCTYHCG